MRRYRVLFFAEAVTLAHVARPIVLARSLDAERFEPVMACHPRANRFLLDEGWESLPLQSISAELFLKRLAKGSPVYDVETLQRYVEEDRALIRSVKPDVIVGDFRLSLSVSARLEQVPYATVTNAYWSPYATRSSMPLPTLPMTRFMPISVATLLFNVVQPWAFSAHCKALNQVRQDNGLPSLGDDLKRVYTDADCVLYADIPSLFPMNALPANHQFIGPLLWSPPIATPSWWDQLPSDKPVIYVTLGSSGQVRVLRTVLDALATLPVTVIASTAGSEVSQARERNAFVADYLPGDAAASRAQLVVCNGGSPTSQQAIAAGVPVLGIASNMDQFLNMAGLVEAGAGCVLRSDRLSAAQIRETVSTMLQLTELHAGAKALSLKSGLINAADKFTHVVEAMTGGLASTTAKTPKAA